jgi:hypothetical protein
MPAPYAVYYDIHDIIYGLLYIDDDNRLEVPVKLECAAGHNFTLTIYAPDDFIISSDTTLGYGTNVTFDITNWLGTGTIFEDHSLYYKAMGASDCTDKMTADVYIDVYDIKLALKNETLYVNLSIMFDIYRVHITPASEKWFSEYLYIEYITSDVIRAGYKIGLIDDKSVNAFLTEIKSILTDIFENTFEQELNLTMDIEFLDKKVDFRNLKESRRPIRLNIQSDFKYIIGEEGFLESGVLNKDIQIITFTRTFSLRIGGIPRVYLNYTLKFPDFVEVTEASCKYHDVELHNNTVKIEYGAAGEQDMLTITFAIDVELKLAPLMPYFYIIIALFIVWIIVSIYVRRKKAEKEYISG